MDRLDCCCKKMPFVPACRTCRDCWSRRERRFPQTWRDCFWPTFTSPTWLDCDELYGCRCCRA